jgi:hypothetical protein
LRRASSIASCATLAVLSRTEANSGYECILDATFNKAHGRGDGIVRSKAGKGVNVMVLVDGRGFPIDSTSPHECQLVRGQLDFILADELTKRAIVEKAIDSERLDNELAADGVEMIAPHRKSQRPGEAAKDGRPLRRCKHRFTLWRTSAWLQHFWWLFIRLGNSTMLLKSYLHLMCSILLVQWSWSWL